MEHLFERGSVRSAVERLEAWWTGLSLVQEGSLYKLVPFTGLPLKVLSEEFFVVFAATGGWRRAGAVR